MKFKDRPDIQQNILPTIFSKSVEETILLMHGPINNIRTNCNNFFGDFK